MDIVTKDIEKIYFDMDGVLVDFWGGLHDMCGEVDTENFDDVWDAVRSVEHFYSKLEPIGGAIDLINSFIEKYGNKCEILTAIPPESKNIKYLPCLTLLIPFIHSSFVRDSIGFSSGSAAGWILALPE